MISYSVIAAAIIIIDKVHANSGDDHTVVSSVTSPVVVVYRRPWQRDREKIGLGKSNYSMRLQPTLWLICCVCVCVIWELGTLSIINAVLAVWIVQFSQSFVLFAFSLHLYMLSIGTYRWTHLLLHQPIKIIILDLCVWNASAWAHSNMKKMTGVSSRYMQFY